MHEVFILKIKYFYVYQFYKNVLDIYVALRVPELILLYKITTISVINYIKHVSIIRPTLKVALFYKK